MFIMWLLTHIIFASEMERLETIALQIKEQFLIVELADELHERQRGLMFREKLEKDQGMLFVYAKEERRSFWMKNTSIPLSIAYIDSQGVILQISQMKPFDTKSVPSKKPAQYALEMEQGWFADHNITVGMKVDNLPKLE